MQSSIAAKNDNLQPAHSTCKVRGMSRRGSATVARGGNVTLSKSHLTIIVILIYIVFVNIVVIRQLMIKVSTHTVHLKDKWEAINSKQRSPKMQDIALTNPSRRYYGQYYNTSLIVPHVRLNYETKHTNVPRQERQCQQLQQWVVGILGQPFETSHHNRMVNGVLHMLRSLAQLHNLKVLLIASPDTFETYHRTWCKSTAQCEILLSKSLALAHVFAAVREHKLCLQSLVLLEESVILDEFFLRRLSETSHDKVTCLAAARKSAHVPNHEQTTTDKTATNAAECSVIAYRVPWFFLHTQPASARDLERTAQQLGLYSMGVKVVSRVF